MPDLEPRWVDIHSLVVPIVCETHGGFFSPFHGDIRGKCPRCEFAELDAARTPRPLDEWHEDFGPKLWWTFPVQEEPYCGGPNDSDWPGYHTHWTPIVLPVTPQP